MLNDFLHSVVQLCGFSPLSMNMCSFNFPVCVNDFLHCAQVWGFSPVLMTIWVLWFRAWLNYFLHSVHLCGFSPLRVSMCRIMWLQISCICLYSLHWIEKEKNRVRMTIFGSKIGFIHCIGNSLGEETTKVLCQRMSEDLFNEIVFLSDVIWSRDCKYPVKKIYYISIILKLVQFEPWYGGVAPEIYSWINSLASLTLNDDTSTYST